MSWGGGGGITRYIWRQKVGISSCFGLKVGIEFVILV